LKASYKTNEVNNDPMTTSIIQLEILIIQGYIQFVRIYSMCDNLHNRNTCFTKK